MIDKLRDKWAERERLREEILQEIHDRHINIKGSWDHDDEKARVKEEGDRIAYNKIAEIERRYAERQADEKRRVQQQAKAAEEAKLREYDAIGRAIGLAFKG